MRTWLCTPARITLPSSEDAVPPASAVIKALSALSFTSRRNRLLCPRNVLALLPAFALCIGGYYLYDAAITQSFAVPLAGVPGYITQCVLSGTLFVLLAATLDKLKIKRHI